MGGHTSHRYNIPGAYLEQTGFLSGDTKPVPKQKRMYRGFTQYIEPAIGDDTFNIDFPVAKLLPETIAVYRNGGEALTEVKDYRINLDNGTLHLTQAITSTDDDIEIRCQIDTTDEQLIEDVLLLPRDWGGTHLEDEQLAALMPAVGDVFEVDKLLRFDNVRLQDWAGRRIEVLEARLTNAGILGIMLKV